MKEGLEAMQNLGKATSQQLRDVGIDTPQALREVGAKAAWLRILAIDDSACYNRLMGLEGAVRGIPKAQLSQAVREDLKAFYREAKG